MNEFDARITTMLDELGIAEDFRRRLAMPLQPEADELVQCENDLFGREQFMTPATGAAWREMKQAALADAIELQLVSAFRSVDYQCTLIKNKLAKGHVITDILAVNAVPGYSEHHTGRALDLSTPGIEPLTEAFDSTPAFSWLCERASFFGFTMSYPKDNRLGIIYEPWHWAFGTR